MAPEARQRANRQQRTSTRVTRIPAQYTPSVLIKNSVAKERTSAKLDEAIVVSAGSFASFYPSRHFSADCATVDKHLMAAVQQSKRTATSNDVTGYCLPHCA